MGQIYGPEDAKILLISEAPHRGLVGREQDSLMRRDLARLAGVQFPGEWMTLFGRATLLDTWPGPHPSGKGDSFPLKAAKAGMDSIRPYFARFERMVLIGRRVEKVFCCKRSMWFMWRTCDIPCAVVPHPLKSQSWWAERENVERAARFWTELANHARKNDEARSSACDISHRRQEDLSQDQEAQRSFR